MKRILVFLLLAALTAGPALGAERTNGVFKKTPFDGTTEIAASGSSTSEAYTVDLANGIMSIQASTTGSGACKVEVLGSIDGTNFVEPLGMADILTGLDSGDGWVLVKFSPTYCKEIKIKVTETGGANSVTPTIYLLYRKVWP